MQSASDSNSQSTESARAGEPAVLDIALELRLEHPPRPPLVLRVGVVGHRPDPKKRYDPDPTVLRAICRKLLLNIKDEFIGIATAQGDLFCELTSDSDDKHQGLRLISSLAEGADQWVASEAELLDYQLQVVLPFERAEYEKDFTDPKVLAEHRRLRDRATSVLELDGWRGNSGDSYLAAGRVMLNQTDLLIALWDGKEAQGSGGTGQIVSEARLRGIPIFCVNWETPVDWKLLNPTSPLRHANDDSATLLNEELSGLLLPPAVPQIDDKPDLREAYFSDRRRSWTLLGGWWNFFRDLLCLKWFYVLAQKEDQKARQTKGLGVLRKISRLRVIFPKCRVPEFIPATKGDWDLDWYGNHSEPRKHKLPHGVISWLEDSYLAHYAWANQLSIYYANHYRSSFAWIYLMGALAVLLALIGKTAEVSHEGELIFISAEVVVICVIIGLTSYGRHRRWHERWIDYRTLAERLRLVRFNCLLGGVWQQVNMPSHLATYGNPAATWMHWYSRAVERAAGLPNCVVDQEYLSSSKELLQKALLAGQVRYHSGNFDRLESVDHRLHLFGSGLFLATLAACVVHLIAVSRHWAEPSNAWLIFCAAFLPALGAAMAAIRSQGEFHRVVKRSRAMHSELEKLSNAVEEVPVEGKALNSQALQREVERSTRLMYNEVLDWRIVFQDRPLVWPA